MQVDLYEPSLRNESNRQSKQISTRKYTIKKNCEDLAGLDYYFDDEVALKRYKEHLLDLLRSGRKYSRIGKAGCDSLFELETLGVAEYGKPYVMIADFSDCLDYVLHRAYGCKIDDVRKIENYSAISRALLNFDFAGLDHQTTFECLMSASNELNGALAKISEEAENQDLLASDKVTWVIYNFYSNVLSTLADIKYYTTMCICRNQREMEGDKGVIRSISYSSVLATVPIKYDKVITLHQLEEGGVATPGHKIDDYNVTFRSYKPYEYVGEVIRQNEFNWRF